MIGDLQERLCRRAGEATQSVKYLLCKSEDLSSIPKTHVEKKGKIQACADSSSAERWRQEALASQSSLLREVQANKRPYFKKHSLGMILVFDFWPSLVHVCTHTYICIHVNISIQKTLLGLERWINGSEH